MNGVIVIDKPSGWTSHDVVSRLRRILGERSIGHLGTLDPLATGVLPLVTGSLTRLAQFYIASEKTYEGVIRFGFATNTYDADGEATSDAVSATPMLDELQKLAAGFLGAIQQVPPAFSAKKIKGVPAYKFARKQQEVVLKSVEVEIKEFTITAVNGDRAQFGARVSSGTYMRSIAHEMGKLLGCGAHLESLRRTRVAEFEIAQAHTLEEIERSMTKVGHPEALCHSDRSFASTKEKGSGVEEPAVSSTTSLNDFFVHPRQLLPHFPSVTADEATGARIRAGRPINLPELSRARQVKVFASQTQLLAIATRVAGTLFHPKIVFPS